MSHNRLPALHWLVIIILTLAMSAAITAFWYSFGLYRGDDLMGMLLWIGITGGLVVACTLLLSRYQTPSPSVIWWLTILLIFSGAVILAVNYIGQVPPPLFYDEARDSSKAVSLFTLEKLQWSLHPDIHPALIMVQGQTGEVLLGGWLQWTGITLINARTYWLLIGWSGLPFIYLTARQLYSKTAATGAVAIAAMIPLLHNYARPDMFTVPTLAAGLYFYFSARKSGSAWRYFFSGLAIGATLEGHSFSIRFVLIFAVIMSADYAFHIWRARRFIWHMPFFAFAAGGMLFTGYYIWFHTIAWGLSIDDYINTGLSAYDGEARIPGVIAATGLSGKINVMTVWLRDYVLRHPIEFGLVFVTWLAALWRRTQHDRIIVALAISSTLLFFMILPKHNIYYYINLLPFTALLTASLIHRLLAPVGNSYQGTPAALIVIIVVSGLLAVQTYVVSQADELGTDFLWASDEINSILAPEIEHIAGWQAYYFGLSDRSFVSTTTFATLPGDEWLDIWGVPPPQAIIYTPGLDNWYENITRYIEDREMVRTRCWYLRQFGFVSLYILPELAPPERDLYCGE